VSEESRKVTRAKVADWFGLNRATVSVLVVISCLGLSEEIWANFFGLHLQELAEKLNTANPLITAVMYVGIYSAAKNLLEGFGYIVGGTIAHGMGARIALAVSAAPMAIGFTILLVSQNLWAAVIGALLLSNWEPLSVPATFHVVGATVPKNRRTIAFAVQSIQKRIPKAIGPWIGGIAIGAIGYWLNLSLALALVGISLVLQLALTRHMQHNKEPKHVPFRQILKEMPRELKQLLTAEIFIRWGDWFARDFALLYVVNILVAQWGFKRDVADASGGFLMSIMAITALATYVPIAKWIDRSPSPRPFIGLTFFFFSMFPISLVLLPKLCAATGLPVMVGLTVAYVLNGLREIGEPARKALISGGFAPEIRARAVGLYWGLRSFAFFPAPLVAAFLWTRVGADITFLIGGGIGLIGTAWFAISNRAAKS
jgi:MFS family permease